MARTLEECLDSTRETKEENIDINKSKVYPDRFPLELRSYLPTEIDSYAKTLESKAINDDENSKRLIEIFEGTCKDIEIKLKDRNNKDKSLKKAIPYLKAFEIRARELNAEYTKIENEFITAKSKLDSEYNSAKQSIEDGKKRKINHIIEQEGKLQKLAVRFGEVIAPVITYVESHYIAKDDTISVGLTALVLLLTFGLGEYYLGESQFKRIQAAEEEAKVPLSEEDEKYDTELEKFIKEKEEKRDQADEDSTKAFLLETKNFYPNSVDIVNINRKEHEESGPNLSLLYNTPDENNGFSA